MISAKDFQDAVAKILKEKTGFKVYQNNVIEGFITPCFFVMTEFKNIMPVKVNMLSVDAEISIAFFPKIQSGQRVRDEFAAQNIMGQMPWWFYPNIRVLDRFLTTQNGSFTFGGENGDILQYSFSASYYDSVEVPDEGEKIEEINIDHCFD